jgi:hypothetical protein
VTEIIDTTQKNAEPPGDASKGFGLEANPEKNKYMLVLRYKKKAEQKHSIEIAKRFSEDLESSNIKSACTKRLRAD